MMWKQEHVKLLSAAGSKKAFFRLTAKNDIVAGSELIPAKLCWLAIDVENTAIWKTRAE